MRKKVDTGNGIATVYRLKYLTVQKMCGIQRGIATICPLKLINYGKDCTVNSVSLEIFGGQGNRLDV